MAIRSRHALTVLAALGGLVLFGYAVRRAGVAEILDGIRQVGWGLLPILGLAGARFFIRACAWRLCMPPHGRLPLGQAFGAFVAGDAIGNLTPLGMVASEPMKVFLTRHRLATRESVAALATDTLLENIYANLEANPFGDAMLAKDGKVRVPTGPGLGVEPDMSIVEKCRQGPAGIVR